MDAKVKRKEVPTETTKEFLGLQTVPIVYEDRGTFLPIYEQYPHWLDQCGLPLSARIVFKTIYHRAITLSMQNHVEYSNNQGHIFVIYTNEALARDCNISLSTVKSAKNILLQYGYITIEQHNGSNAVRIYPRFSPDTKTYLHVNTPQKSEKSNSSFDVDKFFDASLKKHLSPEAYEAYHNSQT